MTSCVTDEAVCAVGRCFNAVPGDDDEGRRCALEDLVAVAADGAVVVPRFQCTYGTNVILGRNAFFMDDATITIGDDVRIGPGAQFMTALHPVEDHQRRHEGWEQALPIVVGDNAWLGASVTVGAGVRIGRNSVIGAGSVVLHDIPDHVIAVGTPAKVIRSLPVESDRAAE